jgi:hypothetical protein
MSNRDLQDLFTEMAADVTPSRPVAAAVTEALHIRRRRRTIVGAALAVIMVAGATVALWHPSGTGRVSPSATTSRPGSARVAHLPGPIALDPQAAPYWPASTNPRVMVSELTASPLSHASLLFAPSKNEDGPPQILAYGEGLINGGSGDGKFRWVFLNVGLVDQRDAGGNRAGPLDPGSLGPMGRLAAFAQPDEVVVVNLQTGQEDRVPVPGLNEDVSWLLDGVHVLVASATQTWLVNVQTREVLPAAADGFTVTPLIGGGSGLTTLSLANPGDEAPLLRFYDDGGLSWRSQRYLNAASAAPYRISYLNPRGWRYGNLIAQGAGGQAGSQPGEFVVVVNDQSGDITHVLDLGPGRNKGCCAVLGWSEGDGAVLVHTDREGLLQWRLATGEVTRLTDRLPGAVSLPLMGCEFQILASACME